MASVIEKRATVGEDGKLILELPEEFRKANVSVCVTTELHESLSGGHGYHSNASDSYSDCDEEKFDFRLLEIKRQAAQSVLETVPLPDYVVRTMFEFGRNWFGGRGD